jgi:Subtilase family/Peptidase inhibitor I9
MRVRGILGASAVAALFALSQLLSSAAATATAQGQAATQRVIVVLKNQETGLPATTAVVARRRNAVKAAQAPVDRQLSSSGAKRVDGYTLINAISATVSKSEIAALKSNPAVKQVVPDQLIQLAPAQTGGGTTGGSFTPLPGSCPAPGHVQLNPQALQTIHADSDNPGALTARSLGYTGKGVKVGFIADGLDINNHDFIRNGKSVFFDYKDFSGQGTGAPTGGEEAFGDASSIAAQGNGVYDVSHYSALPLNRPCDIRIEGVAPGASLAGLDIFGTSGGFNSSFLQAIDYAVTHDHVDVLNESLGNNFYPDDSASLDLIKQANDAAVAAGTTVTVSSGDAGITNTIGTPSTDPNVISVAASTTYRLDAQIHYGGFAFPGVRGWLDNNVSSFSSGGFEQDGGTVNVIGPGEDGWAPCSTDTAIYQDCVDFAGNPTPIIQFGGTSESSPLTAGVAALVIQAYKKSHGGTPPSPAVVKQIITSTADDIGAPAEQQGAGLIDAYKAVLAAKSYQAPQPSGNTLLTSAAQLNAVDQPGSPETLTDTVTNNGARRQTVFVSTRAIGAYRSIRTATVTLSDTASPHITDWQGISNNYESVTFFVPSNQNRLNAAIAFQNASLTDLAARVRMTLVDPNGDLAEYSRPQGNGNYGDVQITSPAPGRWTAYIYSRNSGDGGTTGNVLFGASVARYVRFGSASPSFLSLAPGKSGTVTLNVATLARPGDASGAILLTTNRGPGFGRVTTIPVTLRSLIPAGRQSFNGVLTGGNGRAPFIGQTAYYQLNVPAGQPELNATVALADNPNNPFSAWLVSPSGEPLAYATNSFATANPSGIANALGAQLHVLSPAAGTWTVIVTFAPTVSGMALNEPFTVYTDQNAVPVRGFRVPNSARVRLRAGHPHRFAIRIRNPGISPELYFLDARLPATTTLTLASQTKGSPPVTAPITFDNLATVPFYLLPTHTTAWAEQATTTGPGAIQFDSQGGNTAGDPDIASTVGLTATASFTDNPIAQGLWDILPELHGPFGASAPASQSVNTSMTATTEQFDPAVSSQTGDLWLASTNPAELASFAPRVANPGQTVTIWGTITPSGSTGTNVNGTLYVDDAFSQLFETGSTLNGNEVAAVPYSYTIR